MNDHELYRQRVWLANLRLALDEAHDDHRGDASCCDCYERLSDALDGNGFRFPKREHYVAEPPVFGCETPEDYAFRKMATAAFKQMFAGQVEQNLVRMPAIYPATPAPTPAASP